MKKAFYKEEVLKIENQNLNPVEKMKAGFQVIKSKLKWNNFNSIYQTSTLREAYIKGLGSCADINFTLISFMNALGFKAYPVIISTQHHGMIFKWSPSYGQFNYIIALVKLNGKNYFMDATAPSSEINLLPTRCLNGQGFIVSESMSGWVNLPQDKSRKIQANYNFQFDENSNLIGMATIKDFDYAAYAKRNDYYNYNNSDEYIAALTDRNEGYEIEEYNIRNIDKLYKPIMENIRLKLSDRIEIAGNLIYFTPVVFPEYKENPLKLENRSYPVEFNFPIVYRDIYQYIIPEGYEIESIPESHTFIDPEKTHAFVYKIKIDGNKLIVSTSLQIMKTTYTSDKYKEIKSFFENMVNKQQEKVVLIKL